MVAMMHPVKRRMVLVCVSVANPGIQCGRKFGKTEFPPSGQLKERGLTPNVKAVRRSNNTQHEKACNAVNSDEALTGDAQCDARVFRGTFVTSTVHVGKLLSRTVQVENRTVQALEQNSTSWQALELACHVMN